MTQVIEGTAAALAEWFQLPTDCNAPQEDFIRESILSKVYEFKDWGCAGNYVLLTVDGGRVLIEVKLVQKTRLLYFDYIPTGGTKRMRFWMNASSLTGLRERLYKAKDRRRNFTWLLINT